MHMSLFPRSIGLSSLPQTALSGWKEGQDIGLAWFLWRGRAGGPLKIGTSTWGSFSFLAWQKEFEGYQQGFEAWTFSWRGREVQGSPGKNVFKIVASTILTFVFDKPDLAVLWKRVLQNLFIYIYMFMCVYVCGMCMRKCLQYVYMCICTCLCTPPGKNWSDICQGIFQDDPFPFFSTGVASYFQGTPQRWNHWAAQVWKPCVGRQNHWKAGECEQRSILGFWLYI